MSMSFRMGKIHLLSLKVFIHLAALLPLVITYYFAIYDDLGGDPVEAILHFTGIGAFNLLLVSLLVSPLARALKQGMLLQVRRLIGLWAFTYGLFHFVSFIVFELQFEWALVLSEIVKRPYITVGFVALVILTCLALTSTKSAQRKLKQRWQKLHNLVYLALLLIALHYIWSVKSDILQPIVYWLMCFSLLYLRKDKFIRSLRKLKKA